MKENMFRYILENIFVKNIFKIGSKTENKKSSFLAFSFSKFKKRKE